MAALEAAGEGELALDMRGHRLKSTPTQVQGNHRPGAPTRVAVERHHRGAGKRRPKGAIVLAAGGNRGDATMCALTDSDPAEPGEVCDPSRTALIVYDMQVGVLRPVEARCGRVSQGRSGPERRADAGMRVFFMRHMSLQRS